jgi:hypothetical protein
MIDRSELKGLLMVQVWEQYRRGTLPLSPDALVAQLPENLESDAERALGSMLDGDAPIERDGGRVAIGGESHAERVALAREYVTDHGVATPFLPDDLL